MKLAILALLASVACPAVAAVERLAIVSNGEVVGSLVATTQGNRVAVDFRIDNNGRGPKHHEDITLSPAGIPIAWTV